MIRLTLDQVLSMQEYLIEQTDGSAGILNREMLLSALNAPFQTFDSAELYPNLEEKAAKLSYFLINHSFVGGNKRIGLYVMLVFLEINGAILDFIQQELIDLGLGVASGELKDGDILAFIHAHKSE